MKFILYSDWQQLPAAAHSLFAECEQDSVFMSYIWLKLASGNAFCQPGAIRFACIVENKKFLAILPLTQGDRGYYRALSNPLSPFFTLLASSKASQHSILTCLAEGLSELVYSLRLDPVNRDDPVIKQFSQVLQSYGYKNFPFFRFYNWHHSLSGASFQQYMAARPARLRNTITRKRRKLMREHDYRIRLFIDDYIDTAWTHYQQVYHSSWKADDVYLGEISNLIKSSARRGWLRLAILYVDEQPIAAQIWLVAHKKANIFRLAHDEKWNAYSPGSIVTEFLMHHVIDKDMVFEIDFLIGNEKYKQDWMTTRTERVGIRFQKTQTPKKPWSSLLAIFNKIGEK